MAVERAFEREIATLEQVFAFLDEFRSAEGIDPSALFPVTMSVEELFTNMVKYNPSDQPIVIRCEGSSGRVSVTLVDRDSEPFDVTQDRGEAAQARIQDRTPGGLGLHLVQRMMDEIHYDYEDRVTTIRIAKHL